MTPLRSLLLLTAALALPARAADAPPDYQAIVRAFADTLLDKGRDTHGPKKTALFCGVINVNDFAVPKSARDVPSPPGVREKDRAVGGSNLYQDVATLHALRTLSKLTNDPRYAQAVHDYVRDYFDVAQDPVTGLLAWGEHLYYDVHRDKVAGRPFHELLEFTPPLDVLWDVSPDKTARAVEGHRYHFRAADPADVDWLFNRHADFGRAEYQTPEASQAWVKHAALYAYTYSFGHARTANPEWRDRAAGIGALYWRHRNQQTNLTPGCIGDPRPFAQSAGMATAANLSYWLLKAAQADPASADLRTYAVTLLKAIDHHAWDARNDRYVEGEITLDGRPTRSRKPPSPWTLAYGGGSPMLPYGRTMAYFARTEKDPLFRAAAARVTRIVNAAPLPDRFTPVEVGFGIHLNLDLYDLTNDKAYLAQADQLARTAVEKLWANGLFRRLPNDDFYEAKTAPGELASALLRLSLRLTHQPDPPNTHDWSF